jgi:serine/threonine-protein kinase
MATLKPGDHFRSRFQIESLLGEGAHGEVYAARLLATTERFALKLTQLADRGDYSKVARALATARGAFTIDHPNVARVFDVGAEPDGTVYMVMELLKGCTVARLLRLGRTSVVFALAMAIEASKGISAAHEAQIIHRDIKPSNLFLVDAGHGRTEIKVLDFSTAKVFLEGIATTSGRASLGSPAYMAPEQLAGAAPHPGFDVYALGLVLWEALAGFHPFRACFGDVEALHRAQRDAVPPLLSEVAGLPARVDDVVRRAVAKDPAVRFRTMRELRAALVELCTWIVKEDRAGRLYLPVPAGQPAIPGEVNPYAVPEPLPAAPISPDHAEVGDTLPSGASLVGLLPPDANPHA